MNTITIDTLETALREALDKTNNSTSPFVNVQTYEPVIETALSDTIKLETSDCVCLNTMQICYISSLTKDEKIYYKLALANKETLIVDRLSFSCVKSLIKGEPDVGSK